MAKYIWNIYAIAQDALLRSQRIQGFSSRDLLGLSETWSSLTERAAHMTPKFFGGASTIQKSASPPQMKALLRNVFMLHFLCNT